MIQKQTILLATDKSGLNKIRTFHLYSGFKRRWSTMNFFIKGSARVATNKKFKNMRIFRKGKKNRKGHRTRSIITRQVYLIQKNDSSSMYLNSNCCLNLKKKKILRSKYIFGPIFTNFKRKRYLSVFKLKI